LCKLAPDHQHGVLGGHFRLVFAHDGISYEESS